MKYRHKREREKKNYFYILSKIRMLSCVRMFAFFNLHRNLSYKINKEYIIFKIVVKYKIKKNI